MAKVLRPRSINSEIIRYRAINRWEDTDEFDEWAKPLVAMTTDAECIEGVANEQLAGCRPSEAALEEFVGFLDLCPN